MPTLIEENEASPEVLAVYNDIKSTRKSNWVNNFWKAIARHPATLRRIWTNLKEVMAPGGGLTPLEKEMLYVAVSITNNCEYCIASHTAAARSKGMTEQQYGELLAIVGLASETNRLAVAYKVPVDERFKTEPAAAAPQATPVPGPQPKPSVPKGVRRSPRRRR